MDGGTRRRRPGLEALRRLGPAEGAAFDARRRALGAGRVDVDPAGGVDWDDDAYRWHGRPRWRRVRTVPDALADLSAPTAAALRLYELLADGRGDDAEPIAVTSIDEHGVRRPVTLVPVGPRTAVVSATPDLPEGVAPTDPADPASAEPAPVEPALTPSVTEPDALATTAEPDESAPPDVIEPTLPDSEWHTHPAGPERGETEPRLETIEQARRDRPDGPVPDLDETGLSEPPWEEPEDPDPVPPGPDPVEPALRRFLRAHDDPDRSAGAGRPEPPAVGRLGLRKAPPPGDTSWIGLLEASPVAMAVLDEERRLAAVNEAMCRLTGQDRDELRARTVTDVLPDAPEESDDRDVEVVAPDGVARWVRVAYSDVELGGRERRLVTLEDVTEAHEVEDRLRRQALHDELTGLPNRRLLVEGLGQALSRARRSAGTLAVFFIDVDDLKRVNDTHGHRGGDTLIVNVARALREALRESDVLARIGGDEFVAVCEDVGDSRTVEDIANRFIASVNRPLQLDGDTIPMSISVGVAVPRSGDEDVESLLARADQAMYRAKAAGGGRAWGAATRWEAAPDNRPSAQAWLEALGRGQLQLLYEPVVTADDGILLGVAAKIRWTHPEHGELTGGDLLDTRDVGGITAPLVRWAVRRVLAEVRTLADTPLRVWLPVPARALLQATVADEIGAAYGELGGRRAPALILDIRERDLASLLRRGGPPDTMGRLVDSGPVSLGIDGFRGDAVPLGVLPQLAPRSLRLHPSLVRSAADDADLAGRALLQGVVAAAAAAGVTSIAAEVDDATMLATVREAGVLAVQGAVVLPPRPIDALTSVLHTRQVALPDPEPVIVLPEPPAPAHAPAGVTPYDDPGAVLDIGATLAAERGLDLPGILGEPLVP